ncbi:hypothetical protein MIV024R [Invertebrate iridescent virus 3]|uniref:Probable cysteine proteinase 024R n=1 Tax=Invertebrate iridescent virus 3 TaxID=345201 RepID=VF224_IIV3|nr:hypothetical protein MIV024R [Invertebrate iridescent virus 3]Q197D6.1 RecName: Full=Probable cysteine proteinase 024R [Invertebrate iridescent virus 3]ABF82054.1 hypothetical protein MIV024R [Invertebrate iridescent virus 3]
MTLEWNIDDKFHLFFRKKRSVYIVGGVHHDEDEVDPKVVAQSGLQGDDGVVRLPPLNTLVNFLGHVSPYMHADYAFLHREWEYNRTASFADDLVNLPSVYDWRYVYPRDDEETKRKKRYIMPPDNQYLCGSCWAVSTASAIGDAYVVAGLVDWRPDISPAWALTCYPQGQCEGGSPALLLKEISQGNGIVSNHCLDYSFCASNPRCNGAAANHFGAENLSELVPKSCGCYVGDSMHYRYTVDPLIRTLAIGVGTVTEENIQSTIKRHILTHGPVLAGYFVLKNFTSGYFTRINGGVYFDRGNYIPGQALVFNDHYCSGDSYRGSHAVAIIGWGVARNVLYDTDKRGDVPYWYCRNSWRSTWGGDDGYFKMAMYPWNRVAQFEKLVTLRDRDNVPHRCGGIITFTVSTKPVKVKMNQLNTTLLPFPLLRDRSWYGGDQEEYRPAIVPKLAPSDGPNKPPLPLPVYYSALDLALLVLPALLIVIVVLIGKIPT